jgi:membrane associated rhomboid family serine protease
MEENNNTESPAEPSSRRDGNIDFGRYATEQLKELRDSLDPAVSPLNHAALLAELERRAASGLKVTHWTGRFTRWSGLVGWVSAMVRFAPVYGEGILEVHADHLILHGRQRTWLGFAVERALRVPLQRIRNTIATARGLRFEIRRRGWIAGKVEFLLDEPSDRDAIIRVLPQTRTSRFARYGESLVAFEEQLHARCPVPWLTPLLVLLNIAVFCGMWVQAGNLAGAVEAPLALHAANAGPLTLEGQWWRLLSALFVHANLVHLLLNMWALWNIGRLSERLYGRWVFLALYLGCGSVASLSSLLWDPARTSVGASGAIFAVFGAFLAYLLRHRREIPRGVFRSHWIPTLLFVGFNLFSGVVQPGIDNAAHFGGLLCGLALGLLLARAPGAQSDAGIRLRWIPALGLYLSCVVGVLFYVFSSRGPVPVAQQFVAGNAWYISGEARSNAAWSQIASAAAAGSITDEDLGARTKRDVLPFWVDAASRLEAATSTLSSEQKRYVQTVARFARLRKEWAEAVVGATSGRDQTQRELARDKDAELPPVLAQLERLATRSNAARMTGGLVNLPLVQKLRNRLTSKSGECVTSPQGYDIEVNKDDLSTDSPAMKVRIACQAQKYFLTGDFKALDAMIANAAAHTGDLPAGSSTLDGISGGLSDLLKWGKGTVEQFQRQLAIWRRAVPQSHYPALMEVELYQAWAWSARGHGYTTQVTPQAWRLFGFRNEMAQAALDDIPEQGQHDPVWCNTAMSLQHDRSDTHEGVERIFRACISQFPQYATLYRNMLRSLMPRWFGSVEKVTEFIETAAAAQPAGNRDAMYALLYWMYANLERDDVNIFYESGADWVRMYLGFEELKKRYPQSDLVLNANARFACLAQDEANYRYLHEAMFGRRSATAWTRKTTRADCDAALWANRKPSAASRQ